MSTNKYHFLINERKVLFVMLLFLLSLVGHSQNLIQNSGFENHASFEGRSFGSWFPEWFNGKVDSWFSYDSRSVLCLCNYKFSEYEKARGIHIRNCLQEAFKEKSCSYVELLFYSHVTDDLSKFYSPGIAATYIFQKLVTPLSYGEIYEISYSIFIPKKFNDKSEVLKDHCGFNLSNKVLNDEIMIKAPLIPIDTLKYDQWINIKKYVRPLCDINYVTFGVFRGEHWPNYYSDRMVIYFIDNVSIKKINKSIGGTKIDNFPCFNQETSSSDSMNTTIYFENNKDEFITIDTSMLKKIVNKAKKEKVIISITGHTDNTGSENLDLSNRRALNIKKFILENYRINPLQLKIKGVADSFPVIDNSTKINRAKNRRVEVKLTGLRVARKMYSILLQKVKKGDLKVYKDIRKWLYFSKFKKHLLLLLDPRLKELHKLPIWKRVRRDIKKEYNKFTKKDYAFVLDSLTGEDQRYRTLHYSLEYITSDEDIQNRKDLELYYDNTSDTIRSYHDAENRKVLLPLIVRYGWPKISEVGIRAAKSAFYIIDHSSDLDLFLEYLPVLKNACIEGEAEWVNYANMYDRSLKMQGMPQVYGTQYIIDGNEIKYYKHIDFNQLNKNREKIGLPYLSDKIGFTIK